MTENDSLVLLRDIKTALETTRTILQIQARPALKGAVNALASTPERRKMWILSNGEEKTADLANKAGLKLRAAKYFVAEGKRSGLLVFPKSGCPKRAIDLVPEDWEEIAALEAEAPAENEDGGGSDAHGKEGGDASGGP